MRTFRLVVDVDVPDDSTMTEDEIRKLVWDLIFSGIVVDKTLSMVSIPYVDLIETNLR